MVDSLQPWHARHTTTPTGLGHWDEVEDLFDPRMQECHAAHDTRLVRREEAEGREEVVRAVACVLCLRSRAGLGERSRDRCWRWRGDVDDDGRRDLGRGGGSGCRRGCSQLAHSANEVDDGVAEGVRDRLARVVGADGLKHAGGALRLFVIWHRNVCGDG